MAGCLKKNKYQKYFLQEKGSIADFLIDQPGFIDQFYLNNDVAQADFPEEKEDYGRAYVALKALKEEVSRFRTDFSKPDEALAVDEFTEIIKGLALLVKVKGNLVDGYLQLGH